MRGDVPEGCLNARRAPCDPQFRQPPGMSALRPLDKLPGLNTATILVGVNRPDSRARLCSWAALQRPGPLWLSQILARVDFVEIQSQRVSLECLPRPATVPHCSSPMAALPTMPHTHPQAGAWTDLRGGMRYVRKLQSRSTPGNSFGEAFHEIEGH